MREITLPQLISLIERYEGMPKTIVKPAAKTKTVVKPGKTVEVKAVKKVTVPTKNAKATSKKAVAKTVVKPEAKKPVAKRTPKAGYTPQAKSMRFFVLEALKQGVVSVPKIKQRAAKLAAKAGIKQYSTEESYEAFDVAFFVKMLEEKGLNVERNGEKYGVN